MRMLRAAAVGLVATLVLAACSEDGPDAGDPMSTWTPSGTVETPTESATAKPTEPELPEAAARATEAGARAFITYYWDLINYAQLTGDVTTLRRVSGPSCGGCKGGLSAIDKIYREGGKAVGGEYTVRITELREADFSGDDVYAVEGVVRVQNAEQTITDADGKVRSLAPTDNIIDMYALWVGARWRLDVLVVQ